MTAFNGRRAPNVSQYVANLNALPSAHEVATQQQDGFSLEDDLAMFTNTEFFDFDLGDNVVAPTVEYDPLREEQAGRENNATQNKDGKDLDFLNGIYAFSPSVPFIPETKVCENCNGLLRIASLLIDGVAPVDVAWTGDTIRSVVLSIVVSHFSKIIRSEQPS